MLAGACSEGSRANRTPDQERWVSEYVAWGDDHGEGSMRSNQELRLIFFFSILVFFFICEKGRKQARISTWGTNWPVCIYV